MSAILSVLANQGGASTPPIPSLTNIAALYSSFGIAAGWQNGNPLIIASGGAIVSRVDAPYPLNWSSGSNGQSLELFYDQSGGGFDAANGAVAPQLDVDNERFIYDGTQNLATPTGIISGDKLTIYCVFSTNTLAADQTLLQSNYAGDYLTDTRKTFAIYLTAAGIITVSQKTDDAVPVFNTKIKTLGDSNLHLLTVVLDRAISGAGATVAKLDNSTTGWTSAASGNMTSTFRDADIGIGLGQPLGADAFLDGSCEEVWIYTGAKDSTHQDSVYNYLKYLYPSIP